jgi:glycosyltransferase involved in cell wall biosynthesis
MNWVPNEEGIRWFLTEVWPLLHKDLKDLNLYLAGREMPDWLTNLSLQNVIVLGEVKDAAEFIRSKAICIAPLLSGSGIRVKIIESMALGKAVVSTTVGAEGINYTHGSNILIADSPQDFYHSVKFLYENPEKVSEIGTNARQLIEKEHSTKKIIEELVSFYRQNL